jgi:CubicO group peptidase (beta-lactamase class C family)
LLAPDTQSACAENRHDGQFEALSQVFDSAMEHSQLRTVIIAQRGVIQAERGYRGRSAPAPTNIRSASKSIISALVGIAIDKRILKGMDQKIAPLLKQDLPPGPDPRLAEITMAICFGCRRA